MYLCRYYLILIGICYLQIVNFDSLQFSTYTIRLNNIYDNNQYFFVGINHNIFKF